MEVRISTETRPVEPGAFRKARSAEASVPGEARPSEVGVPTEVRLSELGIAVDSRATEIRGADSASTRMLVILGGGLEESTQLIRT
jgi:hypothetical protein